MESVCLGSDPGHLELKVSILVVVVDQMYADSRDAESSAKQVSSSKQGSMTTHILATSFTPSRTVMFATSNFSNSVLATCRPFPTAQARYP
jgi:hypothetical protein